MGWEGFQELLLHKLLGDLEVLERLMHMQYYNLPPKISHYNRNLPSQSKQLTFSKCAFSITPKHRQLETNPFLEHHLCTYRVSDQHLKVFTVIVSNISLTWSLDILIH